MAAVGGSPGFSWLDQLSTPAAVPSAEPGRGTTPIGIERQRNGLRARGDRARRDPGWERFRPFWRLARIPRTPSARPSTHLHLGPCRSYGAGPVIVVRTRFPLAFCAARGRGAARQQLRAALVGRAGLRDRKASSRCGSNQNPAGATARWWRGKQRARCASLTARLEEVPGVRASGGEQRATSRRQRSGTTVFIERPGRNRRSCCGALLTVCARELPGRGGHPCSSRGAPSSDGDAADGPRRGPSRARPWHAGIGRARPSSGWRRLRTLDGLDRIPGGHRRSRPT
jgi:hypothetical protein